jgi:arsenate reductase
MHVTLFGIRNCDTMKKARAWLEAHDVAYEFHDYRTAGLDRTQVARWVDELGWEALVNRQGTTFRKLPPADRDGLDAATAIELMLAHPSLIKRPVLDLGTRRVVGFSPDAYDQIFTPRGR